MRRNEGLVTRADRARDVKKWEQAARLYRLELDRNPDRAPIWVQYGHALKESGQVVEAEHAYRQAIAYGPGVADSYLQLGHLLKIGGRVEAARSAYISAFACDPMSIDVIKELTGLGWSGEQIVEFQRSSSTESIHTIENGPALPGRVEGYPSSEADSTMKIVVDRPFVVDGMGKIIATNTLQLEGWAIARDGIESITVMVDGIHSGLAKRGLRREGVQVDYSDWKDSLLSGFALSVPGPIPVGEHFIRIEMRTKSGGLKVVEFGLTSEPIETIGSCQLRRKMPHAELQHLDRILARSGYRPSFTIVIDATDVLTLEPLRQTLGSLQEQVYDEWTAIVICDDDVACEKVTELLQKDQGGSTPKIAICRAGYDVSPAELAGARSRSDFVSKLSPGDVLSCHALLRMAIAGGTEPRPDFIYSDEIRKSPISGNLEPFFKPQWSPDLLLSTNYIGRLWCASDIVVRRAGGRLDDWRRFGEYDLILRLTEAADGIRHISCALCQRSTDEFNDPEQERSALQRAIERRGIEGKILDGCARGYYRLRRQLKSSGLVSIIIPTGGNVALLSTCLDGILNRTHYQNFEIILLYNTSTRPEAHPYFDTLKNDPRITVVDSAGPFNFSRICNLGASLAKGQFLLFLNDDIEVIDPQWIERLMEHAERPEVGVVGARLLYPERTVQHAGIFWVAGQHGGRHAFRHAPCDDPGYFGLALTTRNVLAVTGACIMLRTDWFKKVGGFDEKHAVVMNDVDLCLRCWDQGGRVIYEPDVCLIHHELATRHDLPDEFDEEWFGSRWATLLNTGDPYYNPNLAHDRDDFAIESEPVQTIYAKYPLFDRREIRRILALKLDHIGDLVTAVPALKKLRGHFPEAQIHLLAPPNNESLIAEFISEVDDVIPFEFFHTRSGHGQRGVAQKELEELKETLAPYRFDLAIDLRKHLDTRAILQFTSARWFAGYDRGNRFPWLDIALEWEGDVCRLAKRSHVSEDLIRLVDAVAGAANFDRIMLGSSRKNVANGGSNPFICIHPGVGSETRRWPAKYYAMLIDLFTAGHDLEVVLIGSEDEKGIAEQILAKAKNRVRIRSLVGQINLTKLPELLQSAALFVGNNSGPQHIAAALGVPTIGIHSGEVDAREWGPIGVEAVAIQRRMSCSPCYISATDQCPRGLSCLHELYPADVYEICRGLLRDPNVGPTTHIEGLAI